MGVIVRPLLVSACAVLVTGCAGKTGKPEVSSNATSHAFECPVTLPPREPFVPPKPWPGRPAGRTDVWFGTDALWTVLPVGGKYSARKSVWWSKEFRGGGVEPKPPISVIWRRLDTDAPHIVAPGPGTNAFTPKERWWMIAGIDPDSLGCWEVTGTYKGASLKYVYLREP